MKEQSSGKAYLRVVAVSPGTTIQDHGRRGWYRYGVTHSGAMDCYALSEGQALLGNRIDAAAIEFCGGGGEFEAVSAPVSFATSGPQAKLLLDGQPHRWRASGILMPGQHLQISAPFGGVYCYLHVGGGFVTKRVLGSRSTTVRAGLGHIVGEGDLLPVQNVANGSFRAVYLAEPEYFLRSSIRILWGYQTGQFLKSDRERFRNASFTVGHMRDRMGMRLGCDCRPFSSQKGLMVLSDAVALGDIQITGDGLPVVLMADRQTTGGYPRIASVIAADIPALAQLPVGHQFTFELVTLEKAVAALRARRAGISGLAQKVIPVVGVP